MLIIILSWLAVILKAINPANWVTLIILPQLHIRAHKQQLDAWAQQRDIKGKRYKKVYKGKKKVPNFNFRLFKKKRREIKIFL